MNPASDNPAGAEAEALTLPPKPEVSFVEDYGLEPDDEGTTQRVSFGHFYEAKCHHGNVLLCDTAQGASVVDSSSFCQDCADQVNAYIASLQIPIGDDFDRADADMRAMERAEKDGPNPHTGRMEEW